MQRRTFLTLAAASPALVVTPALGQNIFVQARADSGAGAMVQRRGEGYMLGLSLEQVAGTPPEQRFNIGMPPGLRAALAEQDLGLKGRTADVTIGGSTVQIVLGESDMRASYRVGDRSGSLDFSTARRNGLAGFLVLVAGAAAALGKELPENGGQGVVMSGGTTMQFLLEVSG